MLKHSFRLAVRQRLLTFAIRTSGFVDGNAFAYFRRNQSRANLNEVEIYFNLSVRHSYLSLTLA